MEKYSEEREKGKEAPQETQMRILGAGLCLIVGLLAGLGIGHVIPHWVAWPNILLGCVAGILVTAGK